MLTAQTLMYLIEKTLQEGDLFDPARLLPYKTDLAEAGAAISDAWKGRVAADDPDGAALLADAQAADGHFDASVRAVRGLFEAAAESAIADEKPADAATIRAGIASLLPAGASSTNKTWAWEAGEGQHVAERKGRPEVQAGLALVQVVAPTAAAWIDRVVDASGKLGVAIAKLDGHRSSADKTSGMTFMRARNDAAHVWKQFLATVDRTYPPGDDRTAAQRARLLSAWHERGEG